MPRMCLAWLKAIRIPDAVMKPAMTGVAEEIGEKAQFQQAHGQKDAARQDRKRERGDA
jgi:hypothetical protein